jgi:membrane-bound lytic murein transglycosylase D
MVRYKITKVEMMKRAGLQVLLVLGVVFSSLANDPDTSKVVLPKDDPILAALDSMAMARFFLASEFTTDTLLLNKKKWKKGEVPVFDDAHYREAFRKMDRESPFNLVYNKPVKAYIDAYLGKNCEKVGRLLGLAELYFPLFEEMLDRYDLPLELKYLAIVESALNPEAKSKSGAMGLWQFMYRTGKIYNLNSTSYVDERRDPYKSTQAACEYFRFLYDMFGDWQLVLAAYNGGPGNLLKAIRRSGGKRDYWELRPYLRQETQGYVPAFFAVNYVMRYAAENNVYPVKPKFFNYELDTVLVKKQTDLVTLSSVLQIPFEEVAFLNPMFRHNIVPETEDGMTLILPKDKVGVFLSNQAEIHELGKELPNMAFANQGEIMKETRKTHKVKYGETLGGIAARYRVNVSDLRDWNGIRGNLIREGQTLVLYTQTASPSQSTSTSTVSESSNTGGRYHVVQAGDTLWGIAKSNGISVEKLKELNNISNHYQLKIGTKLKIG